MKYIKLYENYINKINIRLLVLSYLECALWTEKERLEEEESDNLDSLYGDDDDDDDDDRDSSLRNMIPKVEFDIDNISPDSKIEAYNDIKKFLDMVGDAIEGIDEGQLGHDIWLTRNHHGVGFFDRGYESDIEKILTQSAEKLGEVEMYIGDDKLLYFSRY